MVFLSYKKTLFSERYADILFEDKSQLSSNWEGFHSSGRTEWSTKIHDHYHEALASV